MESLLVLLLIANLAGLFLIWQRQDKQEKHLSKSLEDQADHLSDQLDYRLNKPDKPVSWIKKTWKWLSVTVCKKCEWNCTKA